MRSSLNDERKARKEAKRQRKSQLAEKALTKPSRKRKYFSCPDCSKNPASAKCVSQMCKPCCTKRALEIVVDCEHHNIKPRTRTEKLNSLSKSSDCVEVQVQNDLSIFLYPQDIVTYHDTFTLIFMSRTLKLLDYTIPPVHIIDDVDYILLSDVAY